MLRLALFAGLVVMAAGAVADIPRTPGGNESELRQKVTIELPEQDASACRSDPISGPELVDIEGGHFWRGSLYGDNDEKPGRGRASSRRACASGCGRPTSRRAARGR